MNRRLACWLHVRLLLVLALAALLVAPDGRAALAQDPDDDKDRDNQVVSQVSNDEMQRLLKGMGFEYDQLNEGTFRFQLSGYVVILFNSGKNCQLYAGFSRERDLSTIFELPRITNEWNRTKRFSKAYIDNEGDPCIEADLDFEGGITRGTIKEFIRTFRVSVEAFARFLEDPDFVEENDKAAE